MALDAECNVPGCQRRARTHKWGMCYTHDARMKAGVDINAPIQSRHAYSECIVVGCDRAPKCRGYCVGHYRRYWKNGDAGTTTLLVQRDSVVRDDQGRKQCLACQGWKHEAEYAKGNARDGLNPNCRKCCADKESRRRYGIDRAQVDEIATAQGGCAACGANEPGGRGSWHVDHDHACCSRSSRLCGKCVRGVLCHGCNSALGMVNDSPERLLWLVDYLERWDASKAVAS